MSSKPPPHEKNLLEIRNIGNRNLAAVLALDDAENQWDAWTEDRWRKTLSEMDVHGKAAYTGGELTGFLLYRDEGDAHVVLHVSLEGPAIANALQGPSKARWLAHVPDDNLALQNAFKAAGFKANPKGDANRYKFTL